MAKRHRKSTGLMDGRGVAIVVIALVSGASFALGFFVGKTTTDITKEIRILTVPPEPTTQKEEAPVEAKEKEPASPVNTVKKPAVAKSNKKKRETTYSLQIGAFKNRSDAEALQQKFKRRGYSVYLLRTKAKEGDIVYKVRIGKLSKKEDAETMALKLKKETGVTAFITRN
jgi:cell division septation protein DedD